MTPVLKYIGIFRTVKQYFRLYWREIWRGELTRKILLTYIGEMVTTREKEQEVFGAIAHPARRRMLDLLVETDRSVNVIAGYFQMSRPAVSQHLRILLHAGLVSEERHGRERRYRLVPARLRAVREWIRHYEGFWDERLEQLEKHLLKRNERKGTNDE